MKQRYIVIIFLFITLFPLMSVAETLTNASIEKMNAAGLNQELIIAKIQNTPNDFKVEIDDILDLKGKNISSDIIQAMVEAGGGKDVAPPEEVSVPDQLLADIQKAQDLKDRGDPQWRYQAKTIAVAIKRNYRAHAYNIDYWWAYTQYSILVERTRHIKKGIAKVLYFDAHHQEALILKGDVYFKEAKGMPLDAGDDFGITRDDVESDSRKAYRAALNAPHITKENTARVYYQLGEMAKEFRKRDKAKRHWKKAITVAPESSWANLARSRLGIAQIQEDDAI